MFDANKDSIANWEKSRFGPSIEFLPKIFEFLGYTPKDLFKAETLPEKILYYRQIHGITQKELAKQSRQGGILFISTNVRLNNSKIQEVTNEKGDW